MASLYYGALTWVPKDSVDLERVKADLYVSNKSYELKQKLGQKLTASDYPGVELWEERDGYIGMPRGYMPPTTRCLIRESVIPDFPSLTFPTFRLRLRPEQGAPAKALVDNFGDKLLCLGCAKGKTILALWYAAQLGLRTLIIVDRDFLVTQWRREIKKCFWLLNEKIGIVQGKKCTVGDNFTIAMVHTLAQQMDEDYGRSQDWYNQFGLIIVDECHMMGAPTFSKVLPKFPGWRLGLSATPERSDGMDPVFRLHMGGMQPVYTDVSRNNPTRWVFRRLPQIVSNEKLAECYRKTPFIKRNGKPAYMLMRPRFETFACNSLNWDGFILKDVCDARRAGRNVLLLGNRVEHLSRLAGLISNYGQIDVGLVDGKVKGKLRDEQFTKPVILATWQIASRALDIHRLDTLFLLFPNDDEGFLRQSIGRLDRPGGLGALVVTYCHNYTEGMKKKEDDMLEVLRSLDPRAKIQFVGGVINAQNQRRPSGVQTWKAWSDAKRHV